MKFTKQTWVTGNGTLITPGRVSTSFEGPIVASRNVKEGVVFVIVVFEGPIVAS